MNIWRHQRAKELGVVLGIVLLVASGLFLLLRPNTGEPLPDPNGYDDFVKAGQLLSGPLLHWDELPLPELEALVATNSESLRLVRVGLTEKCRVPPHRPVRGEILSGHLLLARSFMGEITVTLAASRTNEAAMSALDCIHFGQECCRGGPMLDNWTGDIIQRLGLGRLEPLIQSVDAATARKVAASLEVAIAKLEPAVDVLKHERRWVWSGRYGVTAPIRYLLDWRENQRYEASTVQKNAQITTRLTKVMLSFAARAYELEQGRRPAIARELVPRYLKAVPNDPVSGLEMSLP